MFSRPHEEPTSVTHFVESVFNGHNHCCHYPLSSSPQKKDFDTFWLTFFFFLLNVWWHNQIAFYHDFPMLLCFLLSHGLWPREPASGLAWVCSKAALSGPWLMGSDSLFWSSQILSDKTASPVSRDLFSYRFPFVLWSSLFRSSTLW